MERQKIADKDYRGRLASGEVSPGDFIFVPGSPSLVFEVKADGDLEGLAASYSPEEAIGDNQDWVVYRWSSDRDSS